MADARTMSGNALTRKVGPLPVWGWAVGLLLAYFLYQRYKGSAAANTSSTQGTSSGASGADMNPVPVGTAQNDSGLGSGFGGGPTNIYNYYGSNPVDTGGTGNGSVPFSGDITGTQAGGGQLSGGGSGGSPGGSPPPATSTGSSAPSSSTGGVHWFGPSGSGVWYPPAPSPQTVQAISNSFAPAGISPPGTAKAV